MRKEEFHLKRVRQRIKADYKCIYIKESICFFKPVFKEFIENFDETEKTRRGEVG